VKCPGDGNIEQIHSKYENTRKFHQLSTSQYHECLIIYPYQPHRWFNG